MQESKLPPGYVPLTHHSLAGFSSNGESKGGKSRSNDGGGRGGRGRSGGQNKRRPMKPRMNVGAGRE